MALMNWWQKHRISTSDVKFKTLTFGRLNRLILKVLFTNIRMYIFVFAFSAVIFTLASWIWNNYSYDLVLPPVLMNFLIVSIFLSSFYIGVVIVEWRAKNFLKNIKSANISRLELYLSFFVANCTMVLCSFVINLLLYNIFTLIPFFNFHLVLLTNLQPFIWIIFIVGMLLMILFMTAFYLLLAGMINNRAGSFGMILICTVFFMVFSDAFVNPSMTNDELAFLILGYLDPAKYFIWFNMLVTSYSFLDAAGISQIIQNQSPYWIAFTQIWHTILPIIIWIGLAITGHELTFKWGMKG